MKKIIAMLAVLCVAAGFTACGNNKNENNKPSEGINSTESYTDPVMKEIANALDGAAASRDELQKNKDKLSDSARAELEELSSRLDDITSGAFKEMEKMDADELDELKSEAAQINNSLLELSMALNSDTTSEYKTYGSDDPYADVKNEIIKVCESAFAKRKEISGLIEGKEAVLKSDFDELTERLYNVQQKIHKEMDNMPEEELANFKTETEALDVELSQLYDKVK